MAPSLDKRTPSRRFKLGQILFDPTVSIQGDSERAKARLLTVVMFVYCIVLLALLLSMVFLAEKALPPGQKIPPGATTRVGAAILCGFVAYGFARTQHFRKACVLFVLFSAGNALMTVVVSTEITVVLQSLDWLLITPLLASLILSDLALALISAVTVAATLGAAQLATPEFRITIQSSTFFFISASLLVLLGSNLRNRAEKRLTEQQASLFHSSKFTALGEMAGGIAHEVNTPLATIQLTAEQLQELFTEDNFDRVEAGKMAQRLVTTSQRISKIIKALRAISREGMEDPLVTIQVSSLIGEVLEICTQRMVEDGIECRVKPIPESLTIHCQPVQIEQILLNLLGNARDAVKNLAEKWVEVSAHPSDNEVEITVTDSGPGIPEAVRKKLFTPFFTTKPLGQGTGLGLSISRSIVERHQGKLWIDDTNAHTRFVITLPTRAPS